MTLHLTNAITKQFFIVTWDCRIHLKPLQLAVKRVAGLSMKQTAQQVSSGLGMEGIPADVQHSSQSFLVSHLQPKTLEIIRSTKSYIILQATYMYIFLSSSYSAFPDTFQMHKKSLYITL